MIGALTFAGHDVPAIGMGTWYFGEGRAPAAAEADALRAGLDLGLRVIDTAEMYAEGGAERVVGQALRGRRDQGVVVSKVYPHNASRAGIPDGEACATNQVLYNLTRRGPELDLFPLMAGVGMPRPEPAPRRGGPGRPRRRLPATAPPGSTANALTRSSLP